MSRTSLIFPRVGRLVSIQILRAVAALSVVVFHVYKPLEIGAAGVDIFFVISGFIIARFMWRKSPAKFIRDRFYRIYPIYWLCSVPRALVVIYIDNGDSLVRSLASLTLWPIFDGKFQMPYLAAAWTLSFEVLFYACAALVLIDKRALCLVLTFFLTAMAGAFLTGSPILSFVGNTMILEFLFGALIAWKGPTDSPRLGLLAVLVALPLFAIPDAHEMLRVDNVTAMMTPERALLWGIPAALLVWGGLQLERHVSGWKVLPVLGDASYSIYLTHGMTLLLLLSVEGHGLLKIAIAIAVGTATHIWIEKPVLSALRKKPAIPILEPAI